MRLRPWMIFVVFLCMGCGAVGPRIKGPAGSERTAVTGTNANVAEWDENGNVRSVLQGGFPAQIETGPDGANIQASGQPRVLTFSVTTGADGSVSRIVTLADPSDTELTGFKMLPDGSISLDAFGASSSVPLAVQNEAIIRSIMGNEHIADAQKEAFMAALAAGQSVAEALSAVFAPGPRLPKKAEGLAKRGPSDLATTYSDVIWRVRGDALNAQPGEYDIRVSQIGLLMPTGETTTTFFYLTPTNFIVTATGTQTEWLVRWRNAIKSIDPASHGPVLIVDFTGGVR